MYKRWVAVFIAIVFFIFSFFILYDQKANIGIWFQISDLNHETFALAFLALGIGVLIGASVVNCGGFDERVKT
jgi:hypothetical protein